MSGFQYRTESAGGKLLEFKKTATAGAAQLPQPEPKIVHAVNAQISALPEPLKLIHGPILATVETWSDGDIVARFPCAALEGSGGSDTAALEDLASAIFDFAKSIKKLLKRGDKIGGPLKQEWDSLTSLVDVSGLDE